MKGLVYQDDATDHDGYVMTATATLIEHGKHAARVGDLVCCRLHGGVYPIVEGDATMIWEGKALAVDGSQVACGCRVRASQTSMLVN